MTSKEPDIKKRVEQFYKLLSDYGLTDKAQTLSKQRRRDIDKIFPD